MKRPDIKGVSPVIAVILMVAIAVILAGVVALWAFNFLDFKKEKVDLYVFNVQLDATNDLILIDLVAGDALNSSFMYVHVDSTSVRAPSGMYYAGDTIVINSPEDLIHGQEYSIKIVVDNRVVLETKKTAVQ